MSGVLQLCLLVAILFYFVFLVVLIKKKALVLKYSLLWFLFGIIMLVIVIFPSILDWFAGLVGIYSPVNALFAVCIFCSLLLLISISSIVSKLNTKIKNLTQQVALLEERIRVLDDNDEV